MYGYADLRQTARPRAPRHPEYRDWTRVAVALSHRAPVPVPLDLAISAGVESGALPPAAADMPVATAQRLAREMGLRPGPRRTRRTFADYPMQTILIDGSGSRHLIVDRRLPDGDWLLKLHRAPVAPGSYKNKPLPEHRLRLWVYGIWDMCTGYTRAHYVVARGESALDQMAALAAMLTPTGDPERPLHGVPDHIWSDNGVWAKSVACQDLVARLGSTLSRGMPYEKERQRRVERPWRTLWARFEASLLLLDRDSIRLSALRERLAGYERDENGRRLSRTPVAGRAVSRAAAWVALSNGRPDDNRLRHLPDNPLQTLVLETRRKIDRSGIVRWDGVEYECREWHNVWVLARRAVGGDAAGDDAVVLEHPVTGERVTARPLRGRAYGEVRGIPSTPLDALLRDTTPVGGDVYQSGNTEADPRVTPLPARAVAAAPVDDPMSVTVRDIDAALALFHEIYPHRLTAGDRDVVIGMIEARGLDRTAITDLAAELAADTITTNGETTS